VLPARPGALLDVEEPDTFPMEFDVEIERERRGVRIA
jgi:hypothetical protein